jgi:hypothetical protein
MGRGSATISWTTDQPSTTEVAYGTSTTYDKVVRDPTLVITHQVRLTGLTSEQTYHYQIRSTNAAGVTVASTDRTLSAR